MLALDIDALLDPQNDMLDSDYWPHFANEKTSVHQGRGRRVQRQGFALKPKISILLTTGPMDISRG